MPIRVDKTRLNRFLNPCSVAVIGGREAETVLRQCQKLDYAGPMWAINPRREEMAGIPCLGSVDELPEAPDAVFIGIPAGPTIELVDRLRELGTGGVVCLASGFSEVGSDGGNRQQQLIEAAGDMPVLGPNCYGYINTLLGAALFPDQHGLSRTENGVAIISSSGNIGINFTLQQRGLPISWLITIGNQAVIGMEEGISAALDNDDVRAIGLHMEGLRDIPLFIELATEARKRGKPIIVLKTGKSDIGARITMSHTATLAGESGLYEALFKRLGVGLVDTVEEFLETLKLAWIHGPLPGNHIASMSCSGGEASLIADLSVGRNLEFPPIEEQHRDLLRDTLNEYVAIDNPLDYHTFIWGDRERMTATFSAMMAGKYDLTILVIDYPYVNDCDVTDWIATTRSFIDSCVNTRSRGAVVTCLTESYGEEVMNLLIRNGVAPLQGMDQALVAVETLAAIGMAWSDSQADPIPSHPGMELSGSRGLDEYRAKELLRDFGLPVPLGARVDSDDQLDAVAAQSDFPLVLKVVGDEIVHKSELGGVVVGIKSLDELRTHAQSMQEISGTLMVEEMVCDAVAEVLVGVSYDAQFGHYLILGYGGVTVELFKDREILLFPLSRVAVIEALKRLKSWPLLDGYRGKPKADVKAIAEFVEDLSQLIQTRGRDIVELEINPLMVRKSGQGVVAADALVRLADHNQMNVESDL